MRLLRVGNGADGRSRLEDCGEIELAPMGDNDLGIEATGLTVAVFGEAGGDGVTWYLRQIEPGGGMSLHVYPGAEAGCFQLGGELVLVLEDGSRTLIGRSDIVLIEGEARHSWQNEGSEPSITAVAGTGSRAV